MLTTGIILLYTLTVLTFKITHLELFIHVIKENVLIWVGEDLPILPYSHLKKY